jgi:hypothetical protein
MQNTPRMRVRLMAVLGAILILTVLGVVIHTRAGPAEGQPGAADQVKAAPPLELPDLPDFKPSIWGTANSAGQVSGLWRFVADGTVCIGPNIGTMVVVPSMHWEQVSEGIKINMDTAAMSAAAGPAGPDLSTIGNYMVFDLRRHQVTPGAPLTPFLLFDTARSDPAMFYSRPPEIVTMNPVEGYP